MSISILEIDLLGQPNTDRTPSQTHAFVSPLFLCVHWELIPFLIDTSFFFNYVTSFPWVHQLSLKVTFCGHAGLMFRLLHLTHRVQFHFKFLRALLHIASYIMKGCADIWWKPEFSLSLRVDSSWKGKVHKHRTENVLPRWLCVWTFLSLKGCLVTGSLKCDSWRRKKEGEKIGITACSL